MPLADIFEFRFPYVSENVNTKPENAIVKWNTIEDAKTMLCAGARFLTQCICKKAIRSINSSIAPEKTLGPYPGKMSDRLNKGGVPNLCGF